jgi:hypothetical protein
MNIFEQWFMRRIIRREVTQGFSHSERITELFRMIRAECEHEFNEDTLPALNANLNEWFADSLRKPT